MNDPLEVLEGKKTCFKIQCTLTMFYFTLRMGFLKMRTVPFGMTLRGTRLFFFQAQLLPQPG